MANSETSANSRNCGKIEAIVSAAVRGQMVLPKDLREKANLQSGGKLALVS